MNVFEKLHLEPIEDIKEVVDNVSSKRELIYTTAFSTRKDFSITNRTDKTIYGYVERNIATPPPNEYRDFRFAVKGNDRNKKFNFTLRESEDIPRICLITHGNRLEDYCTKFVNGKKYAVTKNNELKRISI